MKNKVYKRKPCSEATKLKISNTEKGKKVSEATKKKISEHSKKYPRRYWLNKTRSLKTKEKIRKVLKGKKLSEETKQKMKGRIAWNKGLKGFMIGEKNPNWKGGITSLSFVIRHCFEYKQWHSDIFQRDNWTCQTCGAVGCHLEAHHKKGFAQIIKDNNITSLIKAQSCKELWDIDNGVTLCRDCHRLTKNYLFRGKT